MDHQHHKDPQNPLQHNEEHRHEGQHAGHNHAGHDKHAM